MLSDNPTCEECGRPAARASAGWVCYRCDRVVGGDTEQEVDDVE